MSKTRMFIAVELSPQVRKRAADLIRQLQSGEVKVSWVAPANMHITLKFLGDQTDDRLATICQAVQQAVLDVPPFEFSCQGAGAFPHCRRPRTIWIGVREGAEQLKQLQQCVERELADHDFPREHRGFQPHLTIGRVRAGGAGLEQLGQQVEKCQDFALGPVLAEEVLVFASQLQRGGPMHEVLARAPLQG